jgi:uncharacterized protein
MTQTWYVELAPDECAAKLASARVGRIGVVVDGRPEIYPVVHHYDDRTGTIVFPSRPGTKLHAALHWPYVAFEVDGLDSGDDGGWSVLVVGRAELVTDPGEIDWYDAVRRVAWAAGPSARWLRVVPTTMTGRRIRAAKP